MRLHPAFRIRERNAARDSFELQRAAGGGECMGGRGVGRQRWNARRSRDGLVCGRCGLGGGRLRVWLFLVLGRRGFGLLGGGR